MATAPTGKGDLAGVAYHEVDTIRVLEYCHTRNGTGSASEVHILIRARGVHHPMVMRYSAAQALDALIESLQKYRALVWPPRG